MNSPIIQQPNGWIPWLTYSNFKFYLIVHLIHSQFLLFPPVLLPSLYLTGTHICTHTQDVLMSWVIQTKIVFKHTPWLLLCRELHCLCNVALLCELASLPVFREAKYCSWIFQEQYYIVWVSILWKIQEILFSKWKHQYVFNETDNMSSTAYLNYPQINLLIWFSETQLCADFNI